MQKPTLTATLTAGLMATAGFTYAQDTQLKVDQQSEDRAVITIDKDAQQKQMSKGQKVQQDQSVSGTIVSLETYLRDGADAAKRESASSVGMERPKAIIADNGDAYVVLGMAPASRSAMQDRSSSERRASLETAEGRAAVGSPGYEAEARSDMDRQTRTTTTTTTSAGTSSDAEDRIAAHESPGYRTDGKDEPRTDEGLKATEENSGGTLGMAGQPATGPNVDERLDASPDPEDPHKLRQSPGYELSTDDSKDADRTVRVKTDRDVDTTARVDVDADADTRTKTTVRSTEVDVDRTREVNPAPGRELHTHRADMSARDERQLGDNDADTTIRTQRSSENVYGYADRDGSQKQLRVGDKVRVTGDVYERNGMKGIEISEVNRM